MNERPWKDGRSPMELAGAVPASAAAPTDEDADGEDAGISDQWFAEQEDAATAEQRAGADPDYVPAFEVPEAEDAAEQHPASISFWGKLAPITEPVILNYQRRRATFRLLDMETEEELLDMLQPVPQHRRTLAEARARLYFSLVAIDGRRTLPPGPAREAWIKKIPGPFADALLSAYQIAARRPVEELGRIAADPFTDAAPLESGAF